MKRTFLTILLAAATVGLALSQEREDRFLRTMDIGPDGELSLSNISGDIRIEATSGTELTIEALKRLHGGASRDLLESVEIDVFQTGNRVRVETRYPRSRRGHDRQGGVSVSYRVSVPEGTAVETSSVSGDVTVTGVAGPTSVNSVSGEVTAMDVSNLLRAKSVSGGVEVRRARSRRGVEIASVSGDVVIEDIEAEGLSVSSVSGDVRIDEVTSARGSLSSVSGDLHYNGRIARGGRYEFKTHSGDVVITIGEDVGFELESSTFSGELESEFPMRVTSTERRGRKLAGVVGDGSAFIEATTFSGDVLLRRR